MRRFLRWVFRIIAGLILVLLVVLGVRQARQAGAQAQVIGKILPSSFASKQAIAGPLVVDWNAEDHILRVRYTDSGEQYQLWESRAGLSFVGAGQGELAVEEARGSFFIDDQMAKTCSRQSVDQLTEQNGTIRVQGTLACSDGSSTSYNLDWQMVGELQLQWDLEFGDPALNRSYLIYASTADEHFYGFGEQFTHADLKGYRVPVLISEQGIGRGDQPISGGANVQARAGGSAFTTYAAVPFYMTSTMHALYLINDQFSVFDLRAPDYVHLKVAAPTITGRLIIGKTPAELLNTYTSVTGRMRPLPDWAISGAIIGMQGGTAKVRTVWQQLQANNTPVAGFWLQDWVGQRTTSFGKQLWWNWELDRDHYPNWDALVTDLHNQDVRVLTYINPFLADVSEKPNHRRNLFQEARAAGYLITTPEGEPYLIQNTSFSAGLLDLTNPAAYSWIQKVITDEMLAVGADGWMADFGEALPFDAQLQSGISAADYHNHYPVEWAKLNRETIDAAGVGEDAVFFMRAGFRESPRYSTLFWLGDQMVSWDRNDGLKSAVTGLLSGGMSGYSLNHSDIGGYTTVTSPIANYHRSAELLKRWSELNAFTTIYRTHEGNQPANNVQFYDNPDSLAHFSRFAKVYAAWSDYRRQLVDEAAATGMPVARHMFLEFPDDPNVYTIDYQQYMLGNEFLIAPVLDPGISEIELYLPAGRWTHVWSGETYGDANSGTTITIAAPIGEPAVFYRENSPVGQAFVTNLQSAGVLER